MNLDGYELPKNYSKSHPNSLANLKHMGRPPLPPEERVARRKASIKRYKQSPKGRAASKKAQYKYDNSVKGKDRRIKYLIKKS